MKIDDLKDNFILRVKSRLNVLDDLMADASQRGDHHCLAKLFHESIVAENLLDCLEGKYLDKDQDEIILYPSDTKSTPSVRIVKTRHEIDQIVGGNLELAKFNANGFSIFINGDAKKTGQPNPYLPHYRGIVVMASNRWEKLPLK